MRTKRTFSDVAISAVLQPQTLGIGLFGYTNTGKTESAIRLARGVQRVCGGVVRLADTDGGRGLHYRAMYPDVRYTDFPPPYNALDFADLITQFRDEKGPLIIDQMTEEHKGEDGYLDTVERLKDGNDKKTPYAYSIAVPQHEKLVRAIKAAMGPPYFKPLILCWRASDKLDWSHKNDRGKIEPLALGEMPIGRKDIPFEMTATYLLPPGSKGRPCLNPELPGEVIMTKIPRFFSEFVRPGEQLSEAHGEAMARWAQGSTAPAEGTQPPPARQMSPAAKALQQRLTAWQADLTACTTPDDVEARAAEPATFGELPATTRRWIADQLAAARARVAPREPGSDG